MKIYFAGSIRGGREDKEIYFSIISELQKYGVVLTEHIGSNDLTQSGEVELSDKEIFERDVQWIKEADLLIAEVTKTSLGVGYELGLADSLGKKVICLYRKETEEKRLSAMISGNSHFTILEYKGLEDLFIGLKKIM